MGCGPDRPTAFSTASGAAGQHAGRAAGVARSAADGAARAQGDAAGVRRIAWRSSIGAIRCWVRRPVVCEIHDRPIRFGHLNNAGARRPEHVAVIRQPPPVCGEHVHPAPLPTTSGEVVGIVTVSLPLARSPACRSPRRDGLVLRLWLQHAPQRISRTARHATDRMAYRARAGLPAALQSGGPPPGQGGAGEHLSRSRRANCGACCIGSRAASCCISILPRASPVGIIDMSWSRPSIPTATSSWP